MNEFISNNEKQIFIPVSQGYLMVDSKICQGCQSCMIVCSLVHEGEVNLSLARIQVIQNIIKNWPDDIKIAVCRQCDYPRCLMACSTGALYVDISNGNIRVVDQAKCNGCRQCIEACPFLPKRIILNPKNGKAIKCDLCLYAPYWYEHGGPDGKQACVEVCPQHAIRFTRKMSEQEGDSSNEVHFKDEVNQ